MTESYDVNTSVLDVDSDLNLNETDRNNRDLPGEIWKPLPGNMGLSAYRVSNLGRLKHSKYGVSQGKKTKENYVYNYMRCDDTKCRNFMRHVLVASAFHSKSDGKDRVDHINRVRDDNRAENLRWVTAAENAQNRSAARTTNNPGRKIYQCNAETYETIKLWNNIREAADALGVGASYISQAAQGKKETAHGYRWIYASVINLPGEEWRLVTINRTEVYLSSMGRMKSQRMRLVDGTKKGAYITFSIGGRSYLAHRIICRVFNGNPPTPEQNTVNHKDHNPENNRADNLEWASMKEQIVHQRKPKDNHSTGKRVIQYDLDSGKTIKVWPSVWSACRTLGITRDSIYKVVAYRMPTTNGYGWRYA